MLLSFHRAAFSTFKHDISGYDIDVYFWTLKITWKLRRDN